MLWSELGLWPQSTSRPALGLGWDLLEVLAGACCQERSSERGCKTDKVLCRKSVALDLARGSDFPLAVFQEVAVWKPVGPWVSFLVVPDLGSFLWGSGIS